MELIADFLNPARANLTEHPRAKGIGNSADKIF
jgi:hypothetical protein